MSDLNEKYLDGGKGGSMVVFGVKGGLQAGGKWKRRLAGVIGELGTQAGAIRRTWPLVRA